jgi:hypothetical protein
MPDDLLAQPVKSTALIATPRKPAARAGSPATAEAPLQEPAPAKPSYAAIAFGALSVGLVITVVIRWSKVGARDRTSAASDNRVEPYIGATGLLQTKVEGVKATSIRYQEDAEVAGRAMSRCKLDERVTGRPTA